ncbi:MAG: hypothetical protein VXW49_17425, partial [Pseudomonadota bacterium]|nr:hypothetical protein [Pseudomonadota bacterium]
SAYFYDFGIFNEGKEMPWGLSQLIFYYDSDKLKIVPKSASQLKNFIKKNPQKHSFAPSRGMVHGIFAYLYAGASFYDEEVFRPCCSRRLRYDGRRRGTRPNQYRRFIDGLSFRHCCR